MKRIVITLFSGLGSSSLASLRAVRGSHVTTVLSHDFLPEAVASQKANGFSEAVLADVRTVDFTHQRYQGDVALVIGGPPCQPFSQGGRNNGEHDERDMIPDFIRCVAETLPEVFILENVRGLAGPRHRDYLARRIEQFVALGYVVDHRVLDCAEYGAAQSRKRLFVIGRRVDTLTDLRPGVRWPTKRPERTMAEALGWTPANCIERNVLAPIAAFDVEKCLWPMSRPSTTVVGSFRPEVQAAPGYRSAGMGPRQNAPGSVVTTPEERLVLQGLPADWQVVGSKTKRDLQIGNSCPTMVLEALIKAQGL